MTTITEAREAIYAAFATGWGTRCAYTFDNESFDPPTGADWVLVAVRHSASTQRSLGSVGNRKFRRAGRVFVQCFSPLDGGTAASDILSRAARNIFEGVSLDPERVVFTDVVVREVGPTDDGLYQVNVEAAFTYDETK